MHAIILAGGFGTRLRSVVSEVPKPLAPIGGRPFLAWLIEGLAEKGFTGVTLSVHHDWQKIRDYFDSHPATLSIHYAVEKTPLGTGGAIAYALEKVEIPEPVFVLNGDSFTRVDYAALYTYHKNQPSRITMVLREVPDSGRYGRVLTKNNIITSFAPGEAGKPGMINAGIYVMEPDLFIRHPMAQTFSFEQDFLPYHLHTLQPACFPAGDYFIDIGIPEDYARACRELPGIIAA